MATSNLVLTDTPAGLVIELSQSGLGLNDEKKFKELTDKAARAVE